LAIPPVPNAAARHYKRRIKDKGKGIKAKTPGTAVNIAELTSFGHDFGRQKHRLEAAGRDRAAHRLAGQVEK